MDSWKRLNRQFEYKLWREKDINALALVNRSTYDYYVRRQLYAGAADVARIEILERFGGIYIDADSICLMPLHREPFLKASFAACYEYDRRIANGFIYAKKPHHPVLQDYVKRLGKMEVLQPAAYTVGGTLLTSCVDVFQAYLLGQSDIVILPSYSFYPKWKLHNQYPGKVYSRQMWGTTKGLYK